jgi:hypothetical protein
MKLLPVILLRLYLSILTMSCTSTEQADTQDIPGKESKKCDTVTREKFFSMAKEMKTIMDKNEQVSTENAVKMIKLYNTMAYESINSDRLYKDFVAAFIKKFDKDYLVKLSEQLGYTYGKGMTIYLKQYDLYIGGSMHYRCEDIFTVN